jgi:hypothetical protein
MTSFITQIKYPLQYFHKPVNASLRMGTLLLSLLFASLSLSCIGLFIIGLSEPYPNSLYYLISGLTFSIALGFCSYLLYNYTFSGENFNSQFRTLTKDYKIGFFNFPK